MGKRQAGGNFFKKAAAAIKKTGLVGKAVGALAPIAGKVAKAYAGDTAGSVANTVVSGASSALKSSGWGLSRKGLPRRDLERLEGPHGGAFGHRMAGRGRKMSKSGKEYPSNVGSNAQVWHGTKDKTPGGLTKDSLMKTAKGRIVSKKKHAQGLKQFQNDKVRAAFQARMFKPKGR